MSEAQFRAVVRTADRWSGSPAAGIGVLPVRMAKKLSDVVTLEGLGKLVEELDKGGGGVIGEP